jgi:nitrous oxide reductase accessory protein NosL
MRSFGKMRPLRADPRRAVFILLAMAAAIAGNLRAEEKGRIAPGSREKCPVCGMFVAKFPDFAAVIRTADGRAYYFDGVKDLLKFHFHPGRYLGGRKVPEISEIRVTDYYTLEAIDGKEAWYVVGSDVYGPMGKELVPFAKESDARTFLRDHDGRAVIRWRDIRPAILKDVQ